MQLKMASTWRQLYLVMGLAWMLTVSLLVGLLASAQRLSDPDLFFLLLSFLGCAIVVGLARFNFPLMLVNRVMLSSGAAWTFAWIVMDLMTLKGIRPAKVVMVDAMGALAFAFLGFRSAVTFTVGSGLTLVVGGLCVHGTDWELLIFNLFTLTLIGFMSRYGQEVQKARVRVEQAEALLERDVTTGLYTARAAPVLLEAIILQAAQQHRQAGMVLIQPTAMPWIEGQGKTKPAQHAFALLIQRLQDTCSERDVVSHWGEHCLLVGIRNTSQAQLNTRALALERALSGSYWLFGPVIQVKVTGVLLDHPDDLHAQLEGLQCCQPLSGSGNLSRRN